MLTLQTVPRSIPEPLNLMEFGGRSVNQCGIKYRIRTKRPFKETKRITGKIHGSKSKRSAVSEAYLHQAECFYDQKTSVTGL
jgi:hypothetical protein